MCIQHKKINVEYYYTHDVLLYVFILKKEKKNSHRHQCARVYIHEKLI